MTEHPIIFSDDMNLAILDGRKTQTRRVLTRQQAATRWWEEETPDGRSAWFCDLPHDFGPHSIMRPAYQVGDRLWVREAWTLSAGQPVYRADARDGTGTRWPTIQPGDPHREVKWASPIHMPRRLSRFTLRLTDVRVQRVQDISPDDARSEGHPVSPMPFQQEIHDEAAREWFMDRWDELNARRGFPWADNPWVVALTFDVQRRNIEAEKELANAGAQV